MGMMVEGRWHDDEGASAMRDKKGAFVRADSRLREWVRADGSTPFPAESGRYALLVAYNCPWAHRTLILRNLKGLQGAVAVQVAETRRDAEGWWYSQGFAGLQPRDGRLHLHRPTGGSQATPHLHPLGAELCCLVAGHRDVKVSIGRCNQPAHPHALAGRGLRDLCTR